MNTGELGRIEEDAGDFRGIAGSRPDVPHIGGRETEPVEREDVDTRVRLVVARLIGGVSDVGGAALWFPMARETGLPRIPQTFST